MHSNAKIKALKGAVCDFLAVRLRVALSSPLPFEEATVAQTGQTYTVFT